MIDSNAVRRRPKGASFVVALAILITASGSLTAGEIDVDRLVWPVNLVGSKSNNGEWIDPRGLLTVRGSQLGLSQQEMARIRQTIGDVVCPGVQGTGFLIGRGEIATSAHVFVDETGKDRANLEQCFWQNKEVPFRRVPLNTSAKTLKLFTRSTIEEFNLDLAVVRLDHEVSDAQPFRLDTTSPIKPGEHLIMVSASQLRMPSLPKPAREILRVTPDLAYQFDYNLEPIVQACMVRGVGLITYAKPDDTIYSDCSATRGASGSPVLVRLQNGELIIRGVHVGGGQDAADYTDFTLETSGPQGRSYSNALQLNRYIVNGIERFERENGTAQPR